jgi:REP element-mobilizing transposase RayT
MTLPTHGGKRRGAGRPPKGQRSSQPHERRPHHDARNPVHITLRVYGDVGVLRRRHIYQAIREATIVTAWRDNFRIVHMSIQGNHLHLIIEADSSAAISRGMQGFEISAAKQINRAIFERTGRHRTGSVFDDRFHARELKTPREVRNCISYVMNNWRRHSEDRASFARTWKVDPYSSGVVFPDWAELADSPFLYKPPATYDPLLVWRPRTWLLREGWTRSKQAAISVFDVPGPLS